MVDLSTLTAAVEAGDRKTAVAVTQEAIDAGIPPDQVLDAMTVAMTEVGRRSPATNTSCRNCCSRRAP